MAGRVFCVAHGADIGLRDRSGFCQHWDMRGLTKWLSTYPCRRGRKLCLDATCLSLSIFIICFGIATAVAEASAQGPAAGSS